MRSGMTPRVTSLLLRNTLLQYHFNFYYNSLKTLQLFFCPPNVSIIFFRCAYKYSKHLNMLVMLYYYCSQSKKKMKRKAVRSCVLNLLYVSVLFCSDLLCSNLFLSVLICFDMFWSVSIRSVFYVKSILFRN